MNQQVRFKEIRKHFGLTQVKLGEETNTSTETISMIERGKVKTINDNVLAYFDKKGINNSWLKFGTGEMLKSESDNNSEWKNKYEKLEKESEEKEKKVTSLERRFMELQSQMNIMYQFILRNSDKLDISQLVEELNLGKGKASSSSANLFVSYSAYNNVEAEEEKVA
ncbi:helix-turn-helix transcriptional regulator [Bernardetia sp. ABR2-2B]|uniref:helix-turn-helix domain-containing protein n=1 Tax=Bernardetia sp. ABR2-2B TaxID=3127472 RepID=UPI0030D53602